MKKDELEKLKKILTENKEKFSQNEWDEIQKLMTEKQPSKIWLEKIVKIVGRYILYELFFGED